MIKSTSQHADETDVIEKVTLVRVCLQGQCEMTRWNSCNWDVSFFLSVDLHCFDASSFSGQ